MTACRRSRACYLAGCRRDACCAAAYRYMSRLRLEHARSQHRRIDATQTRVWIERLSAHGWTHEQIAEGAGAAQSTITRIARGEARVTARRIAASVLAIRLTRPEAKVVDSTGTVRRLRALAAIGYPTRAIAAASGVDVTTIQKQAAGHFPTVRAATARRITAAYRQLILNPGPSQATRRRAAALGWHGPAAWEDINNPACQPEPPTVDTELPTGRRSAIDADLVMQLTTAGLSKQQIAWELGCTVRSVERIHDRRLIPAPDPAAIPAACGA
ncbi:helix-turn-helix domain-containing protein [Streptomyces albidoflavus]